MVRFILALASLAAIAPTAAADAPDSDRVIAYRQAVYQVLLWNWGPLAEMARGRRDFDAGEFAARAERVAWLTRQLDEAYEGGPHTGGDSEALPAIWENWDDFRVKLGDLQREAAKLADVARDGDEGAMRDQLSATAATCKACHDRYRAD